MITPRQFQIYRRLHHETQYLPPRAKIPPSIDVADLRAVLAALQQALDRAQELEDRENRRLVRRAERRLTIFDG